MSIATDGSNAFRETENQLERLKAEIVTIDARIDSLARRVSVLESTPQPTPTPPPKELLFFDDFSNYQVGELLPQDRFITDAPDHRVSVERVGGKNVVECGISKWQDLNPNGHCKSEFRLRNPDVPDWKDTLREPFNERRWYTWTQFLAEPWMDDIHKTHLMDIHGSPDEGEGGRHPNVTLLAWHGEHRIRISTAPGATMTELYRQAPVLSGRWVRITMEAVWSHTNTGLLRVWIDDTLVVERTNMPTAFEDQRGPYWKLGLYAPSLSRNNRPEYEADYPDDWEHTLYIGEMMIGSGDVFNTKEEFLAAKP
jgi:hypothetical protein